MRIVIVGTGYVGLVSGACLADFGHYVTCVDQDASRIDALNDAQVPFFEPGLERIVQTNLRQERLQFSSTLRDSVPHADAVFITVGTPARNGDGHADISFVYQAAREIAPHLSGYTVIVTKSTVPVGIGDEVELVIREARPDANFSVVSNPEFLREGVAVLDFKAPDRIVIGADDSRALDMMAAIYRPLNEAGPILCTGRRNAELIKYAANAFLAMKITFINEIADLCEKVGGDIDEVSRGVGMDHRIGPKFLEAGPGFGGSCFPKDTMALMKTGYDYGAPLRLIETVVHVNEQRKRAMARKVADAIGGSLRGKRIAILGLTFKPNTDDLRESPAITVITALRDMGARIRAYDPQGMQTAKAIFPEIEFGDDEYSCARDAEALVILTGWEQFRALDFQQLRDVMACPVVVDLRNIYRIEEMNRHGITYASVGRPTVHARHRPVRAPTVVQQVCPEPVVQPERYQVLALRSDASVGSAAS
jgi:UDPglucose 6-dehydrogenase